MVHTGRSLPTLDRNIALAPFISPKSAEDWITTQHDVDAQYFLVAVLRFSVCGTGSL